MNIPRTCIVINTKKFPVLAGEKEEIVNEGMYGKALCKYLERFLPQSGIDVPFYCNEDWGWWLEAKHNDFILPLLIYSSPNFSNPALVPSDENPGKYVIISSIENKKKWYWSKFKKIDVSEKVLYILDTVESIFREDSEIESVERLDDYPW